jgi:hypothetical protein
LPRLSELAFPGTTPRQPLSIRAWGTPRIKERYEALEPLEQKAAVSSVTQEAPKSLLEAAFPTGGLNIQQPPVQPTDIVEKTIAPISPTMGKAAAEAAAPYEEHELRKQRRREEHPERVAGIVERMTEHAYEKGGLARGPQRERIAEAYKP